MLGIIVVLLNGAYFIWLSFNVIGGLGWALFFAEIMMGSLTMLFLINHWSQHRITNSSLSAKGSVDIFLPVVNEPIELFEKTLIAATKIDYKNKEIYVLDDGPREEIGKLAKDAKINYLSRKIRNNRKAGNLNFGLENSNGDFILVLDADQIVKPNIVKDLLGYFDGDRKLALISTRQSFDVPENDFNHDTLFYEHMQTGKNADNAAISCGSGVFYRRSALEKIKGFPTWNIVEDLFTTYTLHANQYKSLYINKAYTLGTAPQDLSNIYKQRGTWAVDTLRLFFRRSPLFFEGLTLRQRLHYFEIAWAYIVSAIAIPILFLLPPITLLINQHIILNESIYLFLRVPSLLAVLYFYYRLSGNTFSTSQFWAALFLVNFKALLLSILPLQVKYQVTSKLAGIEKRDIALILPHLCLIIFSAAVVIWRVFFVDFALIPFVGINIIWMILMTFWFAPIIRKGWLLE